MHKQTLGQQLAAWREAYEITQRELAAELETDFTTVSKWENDKNEPSNNYQSRLEDFYDWPRGTVKAAIRHGEPLPEPEAPASRRLAEAAAGDPDDVKAALQRVMSALGEIRRMSETQSAALDDLLQRVDMLENRESTPPARRRRG